MIKIAITDTAGNVLAEASHPEEALLCFDRRFEPGDRIEIDGGGARHLWVQPDASVLPGEVYLPEGRMTWTVPVGEHRLAYRPGAF